MFLAIISGSAISPTQPSWVTLTLTGIAALSVALITIASLWLFFTDTLPYTIRELKKHNKHD